ncbi:hypothetical protein GSI_14004 [Ganoderma sinense ZZ0214-1]|uniref:DUF3835 domain-containing protein n=1 Tax=Ganoderma sinense ZZ0214-1 TaxID=1077348 RepID=A0A2G8RRZ1_9APHY|nr:hypothetical protein GSI_14004 [Ganoderma sinense ZZ0214-1]
MASSSPAGSAKSLSESRAEALQALLDSLAPGAETGGDGKLNPGQVRRISDRLGELLGEDAIPDSAQRNEKGELVNEEGLPIIDIVEPVPANETSVAANAVPASQDPNLIPLWALSIQEKARRRAERDRILDLLEEEERIQQEKDEVEERKRFKADLEKRKQTAEAEMDALKKAREMQKKMGKALLKNIVVAREREEQERRAEEEAEKQAREERKKLKPKKSVTFADLPPDHEHQPANSVPMPPPFDWGDVSPATLQTPTKDSLITKNQMNGGPMRMNVVERKPGQKGGPKSPPPPRQRDSDDESEPDSAVTVDFDEGDVVQADHSDAEEPPSSSHGESDESDYGVPQDDEPVVWDVEGYDYAQHQREVALAYYEKRATIGADARAAMRNHDHPEGENEWDQPDVPLEATLAGAPPKPSVSRFKSSLSSVSSLPSQSLGGSVLPASQSSGLKAAVRLGKLENGNLIGGEQGESDEDIEPAAKEMLEMLKKGEVVNVGPSLPPDVLVTDSDPAAQASAGPSTPSTKPSRVSQFKNSLTVSSTPTSSAPSSPGSSLSTPLTTIERSSPKLSPSGGTPVPVPIPTNSSQFASPWSQKFAEKRPVQMPGMVVDSPSFPAPGIVRSSSFPGPTDGPAFQSVIIDSPSFHSPASTLVGTPASAGPLSSSTPNLPSPSTPTITIPLSASVLERRPVVASEVRGSVPAGSRSGGATPAKERKVSRFRAERG